MLLPAAPAALFLSLLPASPDDDVALVGSPWRAPGAYRVSTELLLAGGELTVRMSGEEVPREYLPEIALDARETRELALVDAPAAADDEPRAWLRRYEELAWTSAGGLETVQPGGSDSESWSAEAASPLAGREVRFTCDEDGACAAEATDGDALPGEGPAAALVPPALLPDEPVVPGARWDADGEELGLLFEPGGDLGWEAEDEEAEEHLLADVQERAHDGELRLELEELALVDGRRAARVTVRGELARETVRSGDLEHVPVTDGTATETEVLRWGVEGELVWDVEAGRPLALRLQGPLTSRTTTVRDPGQPGPSYEHVFALEGSYAFVLEARPAHGAR